MTELKPVLNIRLLPRVEPYVLGHHVSYLRKDGPDTWQVQLTITTTEGHVTQHCFSAYFKEDALAKAYVFLRKHNTYKWFPAFFNSKYEENEALFKLHPNAETTFLSSIAQVESGEITAEQFLLLWRKRLELWEATKTKTSSGYDIKMDLLPEEFYGPSQHKSWWQFWR